MMLAKENRLTKKEFDTFFASGKRFHFPECTIIHAPCPTLRGAVVVGKKVSKRAVVRNTLRRRVYALLYRLYEERKTGVYIIILKPAVGTLSRKLLSERIVSHIATVGKKT